MLIAIHQSIDHSENIYISLILTTVVQNALQDILITHPQLIYP